MAEVRIYGRPARWIYGFEIHHARFSSSQKSHFAWLAAAHARTSGLGLSKIRALLKRYSASSHLIGRREHECEDFSHRQWDKMVLFGKKGSDIRQKMEFFDKVIESVFERYYPFRSKAPPALIHVTCTGYRAPSGAQRLVSMRGWGEKTQVLHAYHMGCYAAHPALRMVPEGGADVVHTELCSLHLDLSTLDPSQLVIQSLFADGYAKYRVGPLGPRGDPEKEEPALEILATRDVIVPRSSQSMRWGTGPLVYEMGLSKEVPLLLSRALPRSVNALFEEAGITDERQKKSAVYAIHPGGPRIIDLSEKILGIRPSQARWSHDVLREHGNMSSATLPHIWSRILADPSVKEGTLVVSLGAGPGLTLSGALLRKGIPR